MKKYIQKNFTTILLIVAFTVGLSLLLYPTIANWWNEMYAARAVATYDEAVAKLQEEDLELMYADAVKYNELLLEEKNRWDRSISQKRISICPSFMERMKTCSKKMWATLKEARFL